MDLPKLIPVKDIPKYLPVSLPTVRSWIHYKKMPVIRLGRKVFIKEADLVRIANEGTTYWKAGINFIKEENE